MDVQPVQKRSLKAVPLLHVGRPAPFAIVLPAYLLALGGWLAAAVVLVRAAPELARGVTGAPDVLLASHLVGLVLFPYAVAAAVWQLLPVMLRNEPPIRWHRPLALILLAGGPGLAWAISQREDDAWIALFGALLALGLALVVAELVWIVVHAPAGRRIPVNRLGVALALTHAVLAVVLGFVLAINDVPPFGIDYERYLLIHLSFALVGWLTVLIAVVGRTLVPMLALAPAQPPRRWPVAELVLVGGLWTFALGLAAAFDPLVAVGLTVMLAALLPLGRLFLHAALRGGTGWREGPGAHAGVGTLFLAQAGLLGLAATLDLVDRRPAAIAAVLFLGLGWVVGTIIGHLGKLVALSGWGSWPPGPRPRQAIFYPRVPWRAEVLVFALGVEILAAGTAFESEETVWLGAFLLVVSGGVALVATAVTVWRVLRLRLEPARAGT